MHKMIYYNSKLYLFGGLDSSFTLKNELWSYDPSDKTWTQNSLVETITTTTLRVWDGTTYSENKSSGIPVKRILPLLGYDSTTNV